MNPRFAQAGVVVIANEAITLDPPPGQDLLLGMPDPTTHAAQNYLSWARSHNPTSDLPVLYFRKFMASVQRAENGFCWGSGICSAVVDNNEYITAHELAHYLTGDLDSLNVKNVIFYPGGDPNQVVAGKRFTQDQINRIRNKNIVR